MICPICDGNTFEKIEVLSYYTDGDPIHVCMACGLIQVLERRTPVEIFDRWRKAHPGDLIYKSSPGTKAVRHEYVRQFIRETIRPWGSQDSVIDVGAGDPATAKQPIIRNGHAWYDMAENLLPSPKYDVVVLSWVLENCGDPNAVIEGCKRACKERGHIVVATGSRILVPFKKPLWSYVGPGEQDLHAWRWSAKTLTALFARHKMRVKYINPFLESDYLVVIAQKMDESAGLFSFNPAYDRPADVIDFFNRWDKDTHEHFPK